MVYDTTETGISLAAGVLTVVVVVVNAPLEEVVTDGGTAVVPVVPVNVILLPRYSCICSRISKGP